MKLLFLFFIFGSLSFASDFYRCKKKQSIDWRRAYKQTCRDYAEFFKEVENFTDNQAGFNEDVINKSLIRILKNLDIKSNFYKEEFQILPPSLKEKEAFDVNLEAMMSILKILRGKLQRFYREEFKLLVNDGFVANYPNFKKSCLKYKKILIENVTISESSCPFSLGDRHFSYSKKYSISLNKEVVLSEYKDLIRKYMWVLVTGLDCCL